MKWNTCLLLFIPAHFHYCTLEGCRTKQCFRAALLSLRDCAASWRRGRGLKALLGFKIHTWSPSRACLAETSDQTHASVSLQGQTGSNRGSGPLSEEGRRKIKKKMPSHPFNQCSDLEEMMCKVKTTPPSKSAKESLSGAQQVSRVGVGTLAS